MLHKALFALCAALFCAAVAADPAGDSRAHQGTGHGRDAATDSRFMFSEPHPESFVVRGSFDAMHWGGNDDRHRYDFGQQRPRHDFGEHRHRQEFDWQQLPGKGHGRDWSQDWPHRPGKGHGPDWSPDWHHGHPTSPNPEPSTYAMMGLGLLAIGWMVRRRKRL
jgi:PEP-CTERM motif